jgi:hypothetical protein
VLLDPDFWCEQRVATGDDSSYGFAVVQQRAGQLLMSRQAHCVFGFCAFAVAWSVCYCLDTLIEGLDVELGLCALRRSALRQELSVLAPQADGARAAFALPEQRHLVLAAGVFRACECDPALRARLRPAVERVWRDDWARRAVLGDAALVESLGASLEAYAGACGCQACGGTILSHGFVFEGSSSWFVCGSCGRAAAAHFKLGRRLRRRVFVLRSVFVAHQLGLLCD